MQVSISEKEMKSIIVKHLKKRGIKVDEESFQFEEHVDYEGFMSVIEPIRAVVRIEEEDKD